MNDALFDNLTFEQALAELERIVHELEDGQTGLENALRLYEDAVGLLKRCYTQLAQAEQRILKLTGVHAEGQPILRPFDHAATVPEPRSHNPEVRSQDPEVKI